MTDRPRAVAGFIPVFSVATVSTKQMLASREIISAMAGASVGRATAELFIIAPALSRVVILGAIAKNWFGGSREIGPGSTFPISKETSGLITNRKIDSVVSTVNGAM